MEIVEDRHGNHSTIITSQLPVDQWYEIIGEQTVTEQLTSYFQFQKRC
jgi:DNA replication protein DnaC